MLGRLVACIIAFSLVLPANVALAQPVQGDRDLDGVTDDVDQCPDVYGAPPSGCPPQAPPPPPDRDFDGVPDDRDACPDQANATSSGCPEAPPPVDAPPVVGTPPAVDVDPSDEYQTLLRTLPQDYDIEYRFDAPARKRKKENDPGVAAKRLRGLGIAGSSLLLIGAVGLITTLSTGLVMSKNAKDDLEATNGDITTDPMGVADAREDALTKGSNGDKVAIFGSAVSGGMMALGAALLLGARSLRKKQYGSTGGGGGGSGMADKTKRNLTIYGALLVLYGLIGVAAGAVLARNSDEKKKKNGKILLGIGGSMTALGVLLFIPLAINKFKKSARINAGPMWVRGGGGAGLRVSF